MDWDGLRFVLALAREGNLTAAASSLAVTHTTVGRRLRALEDELGVQLFARTPDGYVPTVAGQDLREVAERLEGEVLAAQGRVLGRDAELRGPLRVSTLDILFAGFHDAFRSFLVRYPSIALTVTAPDDQVSLPRREADVVLRLTNDPPPYLVGRKVGKVQFATYVAAELAERVGPEATYADFPWISWDDRLGPSWLDQWLAEHAPDARVVMRTDGNLTVIHTCVRQGIGAHFLACFAGDADPDLRRIGEVQTRFARDLWLLTLPELRHNTRVRAFMDHMDEAIRAQRAALAGEVPELSRPTGA